MNKVIKLKELIAIVLLALVGSSYTASAQLAMQNVLGRDCQSLNGKWAIMVDVMNIGLNNKWGNTQKPEDPLTLSELCYEGGQTLSVPGDWNSQNPEFVYYQAPMWYHKAFYPTLEEGKRHFLHFGAVCRDAIVFLNGEKLGEHQGGFTPFQFEVTDKLLKGKNEVIVRVDNHLDKDAIPAMHFDWWNYGGITRDVNLITTPSTYIEDYWVRLEKGSMKRVLIDVTLDGEKRANQKVTVTLKGTKISKTIKTDSEGKASIAFDAKLALWSPEDPHLYDVEIACATDQIADRIGFRSFEVKGSEMLLNGKPVFFRGINIHEEIAKDRRRSTNQSDAEFLTNEALALGCNFVRLSHYPHNEYMVRLCEEKGLMMWEEIPVWQGINFKSEAVCNLATNMMQEMVQRDKNRCGIVIWSVSNETFVLKERTEFLKGLIAQCREWDNTRAIASALNRIIYQEDEKKLVLMDDLADYLDVIGINKYMGWYDKWRADPEETEWITREDKPMIFSEFGAGGVYANLSDSQNVSEFSDKYMANAYKDDLRSYVKIPNFRGCAPWILFDFRSPRRSHAVYQQGWNRKGLMSPMGDRKEAWYIMKDFYEGYK